MRGARFPAIILSCAPVLDLATEPASVCSSYACGGDELNVAKPRGKSGIHSMAPARDIVAMHEVGAGTVHPRHDVHLWDGGFDQ